MNRFSTFFYLLLLFSTFFFLFFRLGSTSLTNWDEAWFASVASDMAQRRDFLVGHWNGQVWFYEPPVLTTVLAGIITVFGKSEFWIRSFNAALGFLTVLLTAFLGWKISGKKIGGLFSAFILLSDIEFLFRSRQINVEVPVTFFLLASLSSAILAARNGKTRWLVSTGFFLGLSFLTKRASPTLAIPAIVYALVIPRSTRLADSPRLRLVEAGTPAKRARNLTMSFRTRSGIYIDPSSSAGMTRVVTLIVSLLLTTLPWFLYQYLRFGDQFVNEFFLGYTLGKIRAVNPGAGISPLFYFSVLKHAFKIWSLVIPIAIVWVIWVARKKQEFRVLLLYAATFFFALTLASIKSSWFLLPIHPILAIFVGVFLAHFIVIPRLTRNPTTSFRTRSGIYIDPSSSAGMTSRFVIKSGMTTVVVLLSIIQMYVYRHQFIVPDTTSLQVKLVERARSITMSDDPLYLDDEYLPVAVFYSGRRVIPLRFNRAQPIIDLDVPVGSVILSNTETVERLKEQVESPFETLASERDLLLLRVGSGEDQESEREESGERKV